MVVAFGWWGGDDGQRYKNDVWRSGDGVNWELATVSASFSGRSYHQVVSYGGSLWVIGGGGRNDVWRSADGVNWELATGAAGVFGAATASGGFIPWKYVVGGGAR